MNGQRGPVLLGHYISSVLTSRWTGALLLCEWCFVSIRVTRIFRVIRVPRVIRAVRNIRLMPLPGIIRVIRLLRYY